LGSYLRADADRLSDVDIAVELQPKETDHDGLRQATEKRVEQLRRLFTDSGTCLKLSIGGMLRLSDFLRAGAGPSA
jgi:predicted nucleotidyltransferase